MTWVRRGFFRRLLLLFFFVLDPYGLLCHVLGPRQLRHTAAKFSSRETPDSPCLGGSGTCLTPVVAGAAGFVQPSPLEERSGQRSSWELRLEPLFDVHSLPEVCLLPLFRSSLKASGEVCCLLQCLALKLLWSFTLGPDLSVTALLCTDFSRMGLSAATDLRTTRGLGLLRLCLLRSFFLSGAQLQESVPLSSHPLPELCR